MTSATIHRAAYASAAVLSFPLFLVTLLFALSLINPMGPAFLTTFEVKNASGKELWVTPIGAVNRNGLRRTLPMTANRLFYLQTPADRDFALAPGASRTFTYDWDDVQFSEILVRDASGDYRVLPTGLHPTEGQFRRPELNRFVMTNWKELAPASEPQLEALQTRGNHRRAAFYIMALGGFAFPYFVVKAIRPSPRPPPLAANRP
jgi:hypothetical protein